jgi:glycosyltransferase involved in cell wall biosynthesis
LVKAISQLSMARKLIVGITAPGSVGLIIGQLAYFKSIGYHTYLLSPRSDRSHAFCSNEGCELLEVNMKREINLFLDLIALLKIILVFKNIKPDVVNLGTPKVSLLGMIAAYVLGVKRRIYTCRGLRYEHEKGAFKTMLIIMEKITCFCATDVICISNSLKELGIRDKIFNSSKVSVIHKGSSNGFNLTVFNKNLFGNNQKNHLRHKLGLDNFFVFGFLGRIIDRKGINELYLAFNELYKHTKDIRLLILGPAEENQIQNREILHLISNHEGIIWPGRTDEVPFHLSIMDVLILPAWWEGFGNVLVQSAAMGVPVISTVGTGTRDAVKDGFNGILVPVKDAKGLFEAMKTMLYNNELRYHFGLNGIEWAKNFDNRIIWEGLHRLYQKN